MKMFKILVFLTTVLLIIVYSIVRIFFTVIMSADYSVEERIFAYMLLTGELFILLHATGYAINLYRVARHPMKEITRRFIMLEKSPSVAILVAARNEPLDVLDKTFRSIAAMRYPNKYIYFLDDSTEDKFRAEAKILADRYNLILFRRSKPWHGAKAGIVNDCLEKLVEKYVAVFDADQSPLPNFLSDIIPLLEENDKIAFVQTPQFYSNYESSRVARGATFQQSVFYEYICEAKGRSESMFCCGTNVVFRREALASVGGMDESVVTEDFATSIRLHMKGWKSLYYNHVGTFGMGPEDLKSYFVQQARWAKGTIGVLRKILWNMIIHPFRLKISQWWEYILSGTYYFVGLAFLFLMLCPITFILFNIPSFFMHTDIYISVFLPYFSLSLGVFFVTLRVRRYRVKDLFLGQLLTYISFPVLIMSTITALFGIQGKFGVTFKGKGRHLSYWRLWPQLMFMYLNFVAFVWGLNRFYYERDLAVIINCFWALYHFVIMLGIFYFNEELVREIEA